MDIAIVSFVVSFNLCVFLLHMTLQLTIWRAKLTENKHFLIRVLSGFDSVAPLLLCVFLIPYLMNLIVSEVVLTLISCMVPWYVIDVDDSRRGRPMYRR